MSNKPLHKGNFRTITAALAPDVEGTISELCLFFLQSALACQLSQLLRPFAGQEQAVQSTHPVAQGISQDVLQLTFTLPCFVLSFLLHQFWSLPFPKILASSCALLDQKHGKSLSQQAPSKEKTHHNTRIRWNGFLLAHASPH